MKSIFLFLILTLSFSQFSTFVESKQCKPNDNTMTLTVKCEFYQQPLQKAYRYTKVVRSSKSYKKTLNQMKVSASVSGSYGGFSASVSAAYESLKDSIVSTENYGETVGASETTFMPGELQIKRQVVTTLTINGRTSSVTEEKIVDSRKTDKRMTYKELQQRAAEYMKWEFGDEKVNRNRLTETICTPKVELKEILKKRETRKYRIWTDKGSGAWRDFSCWNPSGESMLGSIPENGYDGKFKGFVFTGAEGVLEKPVDYRLTWKDTGSWASSDGSFWTPVCKPNYVALGDYCQRGYGKPSKSAMRCVRKDLTEPCGKTQIWTDKGSGASMSTRVYKSYDPLVQGMITTGRQVYCLKKL